MFIKNLGEKFGSFFSSSKNANEIINETEYLLDSKKIVDDIIKLENDNNLDEANLKKTELVNMYAKHLIKTNELTSNYSGKIILNIDYFSDYEKHKKYKDELKRNIEQTKTIGLSHGVSMKNIQEKVLKNQGIDGKIFNFEVVYKLFYDSVRTLDNPFTSTPIRDFSSKDKFGEPNISYPIDVTELSLVLKKMLPNAEINLNLSLSNIIAKDKQLISDMLKTEKINTNIYDVNVFYEKGYSENQVIQLSKQSELNIIRENIDKVFSLAKNGIKVNMSRGNNVVDMKNRDIFNSLTKIQKEKYPETTKIEELLSNLTDKEVKTIFYSTFIENEEDLEMHTNTKFETKEEKNKMLVELLNQYKYFKQNISKKSYDLHRNRYYVTQFYSGLNDKEKSLIKKNFSILESVDYFQSGSLYNSEGTEVSKYNGLTYNLTEIKKVKKEKPERFEKINEVKNKIEYLLIDKENGGKTSVSTIPLELTVKINNLFKEIEKIKETYQVKERLFFSDYNFPFDYRNNDLVKQMLYIDETNIGATSDITAYNSRTYNRPEYN